MLWYIQNTGREVVSFWINLNVFWLLIELLWDTKSSGFNEKGFNPHLPKLTQSFSHADSEVLTFNYVSKYAVISK